MASKSHESIDIDCPGECKRSPKGWRVDDLNLYPVSVNSSGDGLPYAPEDWPNSGDKWGWKVGKRINASGYFLDRYLYLPNPLRRGICFASRMSVKKYIREKYPEADVDDFFSSFSWKIPSKKFKKDCKEMLAPPAKTAEVLGSDIEIGKVYCKAGNRFCSSLAAGEDSVPEVAVCDFCCSDPGFCRDCCCMLCCRVIDKARAGYSYIRCEANIGRGTCGHSCHIECALRAYLAGTVGGSIGLDAEYYCRVCDSKTDMVLHVTHLLQNCEPNIDRDDIEKILRTGASVLRGSRKATAKELFHQIELAMSKLKSGTPLELEGIWEKEDPSTEIKTGLSPNMSGALESPVKEDSQDCQFGSPQIHSQGFNIQVELLKLEDEIDQVLYELRKSQDIECQIAEETLSTQKSVIANLYILLGKERAELYRRTSPQDQQSMIKAVVLRVEQIQQGLSRLKDMKQVAKGFGRVPKHILREHFGLDFEL